MTELQWPPDVVGRLTLTQLACLCLDRPPGEPGGGPKKSYEAMAAALAREEAEATAWSSSSE